MKFDAPFTSVFGTTDSRIDHVAELVTLLQDAADSEWTGTTPTVKKYWDDAQSERGPGADQPPIIYVWSPIEGSEEPLSGFAYDRLDEQPTIELQVWSLDGAEANNLAQDIVAYLADFGNDNEATTPYHRVRVTNVNDFRAQKPARTTSHYVYTVTVELRRLRTV
jgi:hypothetical protein